MRKIIVILAFTLSGVAAAQDGTGVGTLTPDPDAALEVSATDKGLLLPRIALTNTTTAAPLSAHKEGMTVYNTATAGDVTPGYYYNDGTQWVRVGSSNGAETVTALVDNGDGTFTYTSENGTSTTFDANDAQTVTTFVDNGNGTYTYTSEDGTATTTATPGAETVTALVDNGDGTFTYTSENGTSTTFDANGAQTVTTFVDNGDGTYTYTSEDGTATTTATPGAETVTALVDNGDGTFTYTSENATSTTFDANGAQTVTTFVDNGDGTYTYTSEDGTSTTTATPGAETVTALVDNGDGTFTYTSENGTSTTFDANGAQTVTTFVDNGDGTYTYTSEDGTSTTTATPGAETVTALVDHGDGTFTYTSENATSTTFDANDAQTVTTFVDNGDGTYTYTSEDGTATTTATPGAETVTTMVDNGNGTYTYTSENGTVSNITGAEPWFGADDNAIATLNTEDIYTMGKVGIGTTAPSVGLQVVGNTAQDAQAVIANTAGNSALGLSSPVHTWYAVNNSTVNGDLRFVNNKANPAAIETQVVFGADGGVGIGTETIGANTALNVSATDKGFLPPRVALTAYNDVATINAPTEGMVVYNTNITPTLNKGLVYFDGAQWSNLSTALQSHQSRYQAISEQRYRDTGEYLFPFPAITAPQSGNYQATLRTFFALNNGTAPIPSYSYEVVQISIYFRVYVNGVLQDVLEIYQPGITSFFAQTVSLYYTANPGDTITFTYQRLLFETIETSPAPPPYRDVYLGIEAAYFDRNNVNITKIN
ncbi:hypothetical protein [Winogradskyella sp.]|uniref:beta strand repeat-containing protein n=1 Tax=Winogradskyella sp. TaxID=1883156 RepID=UPI0026286221|nr:hypothetical protein [Winogradskyella sp.]